MFLSGSVAIWHDIEMSNLDRRLFNTGKICPAFLFFRSECPAFRLAFVPDVPYSKKNAQDFGESSDRKSRLFNIWSKTFNICSGLPGRSSIISTGSFNIRIKMSNIPGNVQHFQMYVQHDQHKGKNNQHFGKNVYHREKNVHHHGKNVHHRNRCPTSEPFCPKSWP